MKSLKVILSAWILASSFNLIGQDCFEYLEDVTGLEQTLFQDDIEAKACLLRAEFPSDFQNDFKVFDIGLYAHSESIHGNTDALWQNAINKAASSSKYYLLIGRELNSDGIYSRIRTELVLPTTGVFHCVNENYLQVIKNTLESPIAYDKKWGSYPDNIYTGIDNLIVYIKRIKNCCENGGTLENCGNCPINLNEASALLKGFGYSPIIGNITISGKNYGNIDSKYDINISHNGSSYSYTDHLEEIASNDVQVRVKYYDVNNCVDLMSFEELAYNGADYYEDIIILNFGNTPTILSKVRYDEQELLQQKQQFASKSKSSFIPWLVYQIVKRAAMATVGAVVDFGIQMGIERLVGGHDSWTATWDAIDIDEGSLLTSALAGAFSDVKYVGFATATLGPSVTYMLDTPASDWNAEGFAKAFGEGAMMGAAELFLGRVMKHMDSAVERSGLIPVSRINKMIQELTPIIGAKVYLVKKLRSVVKAWNDLFDFDILRKNSDALDNVSSSIDEGLDALDAVEDAIQISGKSKPTWPEIKANFKRGNDFNRKARNENWYDFDEVHLENGKRLDGYDHDLGEIVSRKATTFDDIQPSTFEKYLKEIDNKYSPGTIIRSNKYPEIDGKALHGTKYIEVPVSNQNSQNLSTFESLANQYNTIIRYRPE